MRGHESLIDFRMRGMAPADVHIDTEPDGLKCWRDWHIATPKHAQIEVAQGDRPAMLDLRCIVGLPVFVHGNWPDRVREVAAACIEAKASRVVACITEQGQEPVVEVVA